MAGDDDQGGRRKPGFFKRLFGGGAAAEPEPAPAPEPPAAPPATPPAPAPAAEVRPPVGPAPAAIPEALPEALPTPAPTSEPAPAPPPAPVPAAPAPAPVAPPPPPAPTAVASPPPPAPPPPVPPPAEADESPADASQRGWWSRLKGGLSRSSSSIKEGIVGVFAKRKLDAATLDDLEDVLIRADLGIAMATRITGAVSGGRYDKGIDPEEVQAILAREVEAVLAPVAVPFAVDPAHKPFVVLIVGVNGSGKTTTIGKLAAKLSAEGKRLTLGAGDTFRAAAIEQLRIWGERTGSPVVSRPQGADAAGLAFDAIREARENGSDVLLIDTAGRLQNRAELMEELAKVVRVIRKADPGAPHAVLLVLDATVGQNALSQVEIFSKVAGVTGLVMTKLDGTARGGILVAVAEKFALPVHFIGVGEGIDDLEPFAAGDFARAIAGLDRSAAAEP
ncbi:signal recognition particle-docking protein FtsY [Lichenibacterium ramalinae]|uniref:Signal recognition particle receptor FtsY n=1 Tax=Lichenibacterium ramalinae TaxID=2316527 RepID=A0A4Q2RAZ0_9HYPH|nr:signal recognition particle-docking protein FtsY [Lichenibacterium ramalinae]RYB03580.1 signal recognition particle-docking protein FtsY [Lichenibacterium ramalinae]